MRAVFRWTDDRGRPQVREVEPRNGTADVPADCAGHLTTIEWVAPAKPTPRVGVEWVRADDGWSCDVCREPATWERQTWRPTSGGSNWYCDECATRTASANSDCVEWPARTAAEVLSAVGVASGAYARDGSDWVATGDHSDQSRLDRFARAITGCYCCFSCAEGRVCVDSKNPQCGYCSI